MGGIEFPGAKAYLSSTHTSKASCADCHMAKITGRAGGHTFTAKGNFNGCNTTACHGTLPLKPIVTTDATTYAGYWTSPRATIKTLLESLATKLTFGGVCILNRNSDATTNLWAGATTPNYDGYLNIYDPVNNPTGPANNPAGVFQNPSPSSTWTPEQKALNLTLPTIPLLTNAHMGAIINFQLCLREYSLGIHNYKYSEALLTNTIAVLP